MKLGLMLPYAGPASIWRAGSETCAMLALEECAQIGRKTQLFLADCGSTPAEADAAARYLAYDCGVDIVVGMQLSHQRIAVAKAFQGSVPYIFTPQYEGVDCGSCVVPIGLKDEEVLRPGIEYFTTRLGIKRWSFVGNDYLWPLQGCRVATWHISRVGAKLVHKDFRPFGQNFETLVSEIERSKAQAVIVGLLGQESVRFHRAFAQAGLAKRIYRFCLALDETLLWALEDWEAENIYACQPFYQGEVASFRDDLVARHRSTFGGSSPPVTSVNVGLYDGVRLALQVANYARAPSRSDIVDFVRDTLTRPKALSLLGLADPATGRQFPRIAAARDNTFIAHA
ncbi:MAG: ABC transporter substrate-binding protein [Pseudomonadota bacterium]